VLTGRSRSEEPDYDEVAWPAADTTDVRRAVISPWDAAAQFGHVEPAFEHLRNFTSSSSSSPFIPRQSTPLQQNRNIAATTDISSTRSATLVNGTFSLRESL